MLPIGQELWMKELYTYKEFPPLQAAETYNLNGILAEMESKRETTRYRPAVATERSGRPEKANRLPALPRKQTSSTRWAAPTGCRLPILRR